MTRVLPVVLGLIALSCGAVAVGEGKGETGALATALNDKAGGRFGVARTHQQLIVGSTDDLYRAVSTANTSGYTEVLLEDGVYQLSETVVVKADHVTFRSLSGQRDRVVLRGKGMRPSPTVENLFLVRGRHVAFIGLTLQQAGNHLVQLQGGYDTDFFVLENCVLQDSYEQLLKVSAGADASADSGRVKNTVFEYTAEHAPNWYTGGIDLHGGANWVIEGNVFRNIASPGTKIAEHAIHLWKGTSDNRVTENLVLNSDRGIGFGLGPAQADGNTGGEISNNRIIHTRLGDAFSDVGISLESSPGTIVSGNFIHFLHSYPNAIEYRFASTIDVMITGNTVNRAISSRDAGRATTVGNTSISVFQKLWFSALRFVTQQFSMAAAQ